MVVGPIVYELVCIDSMLWGSYCVSYKGLKFWGFLAYNLRTVWATAPKTLHAGRYYGSAFLLKTDLRKAA